MVNIASENIMIEDIQNSSSVTLQENAIPFTSNQQTIAPEPTFAEPIPNITVTAGRNVSLPCIVDNLQKYRVAWIHKNRYTLLTLQDRVITRSSRYKVSHNSQRTWWLHITNVQERDRGEYMCQINTEQMMKQVGFLEVVGKISILYF
ncbi:lachesin [Nephila pilipes]|uniref:Lachesin n=1 Tax=Nephila pilipes TaxID=299642 RepID=A0A8X6QTD3_NEPPI|nr:lachesin [Nephila pilipes]